jgi:hypothetical protein
MTKSLLLKCPECGSKKLKYSKNKEMECLDCGIILYEKTRCTFKWIPRKISKTEKILRYILNIARSANGKLGMNMKEKDEFTRRLVFVLQGKASLIKEANANKICASVLFYKLKKDANPLPNFSLEKISLVFNVSRKKILANQNVLGKLLEGK